MEVRDKPQTSVASYQPFYAQLAQLEADNASLAFDYESKKGNKEARSHVNSLRLAKGSLERTRKEAKEESLRIGRAVDSEAKEIGGRIEAMIAVHQVKIDEIEQREQDRVAAAAKAEADAKSKREENKAHKTRINREALAALVNGGITEEVAQLCITMIAKGEVPAVKINY